MVPLQNISLVAFDMFGTLVRNELDEWSATVAAIAQEQGLGVDGSRLWATWRAHEIEFRETRTNMEDPEASPAFRTYWEAWRDAFVAAFVSLSVSGDADAAATRCIEDHACREAFSDSAPALHQLGSHYRLAVLSNADDSFLLGTIEHNGWREQNGWCFDTIISSEQVRAYKPDPRAFRALYEITGVSPERVLYVGDSVYDDAHGAKLAGMRTTLVQRLHPSRGDGTLPLGRTPLPKTVELLPPDHVVASLEELPALLRP